MELKTEFVSPIVIVADNTITPKQYVDGLAQIKMPSRQPYTGIKFDENLRLFNRTISQLNMPMGFVVELYDHSYNSNINSPEVTNPHGVTLNWEWNIDPNYQFSEESNGRRFRSTLALDMRGNGLDTRNYKTLQKFASVVRQKYLEWLEVNKYEPIAVITTGRATANGFIGDIFYPKDETEPVVITVS